MHIPERFIVFGLITISLWVVSTALIIILRHQFKLHKAMAQMSDLTAALNTISTDLTTLQTSITALQGELTSSISPADSDALLNQLNGLSTQIQGMIPKPAEPAHA